MQIMAVWSLGSFCPPHSLELLTFKILVWFFPRFWRWIDHQDRRCCGLNYRWTDRSQRSPKMKACGRSFSSSSDSKSSVHRTGRKTNTAPWPAACHEYTLVTSSSSSAKRIPRARDQEARVAATACQATRRPNRFTFFYRVQSGEITRRLKGPSKDPASTALATHLRPRWA